MKTSAKVIADSIAPTGDRVTTMEVTLHRFVLAELNTHRVFSRNSASSRAIPVTKQLNRVMHHPALPLEWPSEQPGMQGGTELEGQALADAQDLWNKLLFFVATEMGDYLALHPDQSQRLHKSLLNRWLEPAMWHQVIITSTEWQNFFHQRSRIYSPLAQPEIAEAADLMLAAYEESEPAQLDFGDWHMPYIREDDWDWAVHNGGRVALRQLSVARCARVSYLTHDGLVDPAKDLDLYRKLVSATPMHASPLEHVCTPCVENSSSHSFPFTEAGQTIWLSTNRPVIGNLTGFLQLRHLVEAGI